MQHYSHKLLQISLPVSFNFLSFKLEAQIQSQKGPADKESSLPSAVSTSQYCHDGQNLFDHMARPHHDSGLSVLHRSWNCHVILLSALPNASSQSRDHKSWQSHQPGQSMLLRAG